MKFRQIWLIAVLSIALVFSSINVLAFDAVINSGTGSEEDGDNSSLYITAAVVTGIVIGTVVVVKTIVRNSRAGSHYKKAEAYAIEGKWDLAADEYAQCAEIHAGYKDVQARLAEARLQAEKRLIRMGDEARAREAYEEALQFYQKALYYNPLSTLASSQIEEMAQDLVAVHYRRGRTFETQNRWEEAYKEYEKAYFYNPDYEDLTERYMRAKAQVFGEFKLRGIAFFVNRSGIQGIETPLIQALQAELVVSGKDFTMIDYQRIQEIVKEQADALSDTLDERLASDIGLMIGAEEMIIGEILSITAGKRVEIEGQIQIVSVVDETIVETIEFEHKFSKEVKMENLMLHLGELAEELVKKINRL